LVTVNGAGLSRYRDVNALPSGRIINGPEHVADVHEIMAQDFRQILGALRRAAAAATIYMTGSA
jgi:hypothetical protein